MYEKILILFILINIPIIIFYQKIIKKFNIFDTADGIRKLHKNDISLFGGSLIIYNVFTFYIIDYFIGLNTEVIFFSTRENFSFFGGIILVYLVGIYDDKFDLSSTKKLFLNFFIILFIILVDENLIIRELSLFFVENKIELKNISYFFSILCILLFMNALNMFDGINLQVGFYSLLIFLIFIIKNTYVFYSLLLIYTLILFLFYNYRNKAFLGDSGTQVLAFIISYILIKSYNIEKIFSPEEIFIILSFPGLDMFRLFLFRILNGKNPFHADIDHIHHLITKKLNSFYAFFIIFSVIVLNILVFYIFTNSLFSILLILSSYLILFFVFKKREVKN